MPLYALSQVLKLPPLAIITTRAPTFVSQPRTGDIYGLGETISFRAEFSEPVSVRGVPTYLLKLDSGDVRARYISGSGTDGLVFAYTVQVDDYDEDGVSIVIPLGDSPIELDGSTIQAVADGSEVNLVADRTLRYSNSAHKVEARPPQATTASISSSPESGTTYGTGETITVTLTMRADVRVTGRPWIFVDVGGALRRADYIGPIGTATDALEFTYTVQAGDFDADGVALCASGLGCGSLQLNGGSIRGAADELEADLRLPALAAQSGHKVDAAEPVLPPVPTDVHGRDQGAGRLAIAAFCYHRRRDVPADVQDFEHARRYLFEHRRLRHLCAGPGGGGAHGDPALQCELPGAGKHSLNRRQGQHLHHRHECPNLLVERGQSCGQLPRLLRRGVG